MAKKFINLGRTLKELLFKHDLKPADLARKVNLPPPTIHRLITGKSTRPYKSSLQPIADYFAISVDELIGDTNKLHISNQSNKSTLSNDIKLIPLISWNDVINLKNAKPHSEHQIAISGKISENSFALIMPDSSMEPLFPYGSILIFNPETKIRDRGYVLIKVSGRKTPVFRQLVIDLEHQFIKPLNPDLSQAGIRLMTNADKIIASLYESRLNPQILDDEEFVKELIHVD